MTSASESNAGGSRERRVRVTLDLTRDQHGFLRRFAFETEADASAILRALLALLEEDSALATRVLARVERKYSR